jgi:hypothetical protein
MCGGVTHQKPSNLQSPPRGGGLTYHGSFVAFFAAATARAHRPARVKRAPAPHDDPAPLPAPLTKSTTRMSGLRATCLACLCAGGVKQHSGLRSRPESRQALVVNWGDLPSAVLAHALSCLDFQVRQTCCRRPADAACVRASILMRGRAAAAGAAAALGGRGTACLERPAACGQAPASPELAPCCAREPCAHSLDSTRTRLRAATAPQRRHHHHHRQHQPTNIPTHTKPTTGALPGRAGVQALAAHRQLSGSAQPRPDTHPARRHAPAAARR